MREPPYDRCVFVNCPFDPDYKPILDAIVFTIHDCGFVARIALEDVGSGRIRIDKIRDLILKSRYSIHDLSRINEPRLNMAFEAGICFGAKFFGGKKHATKDFLVLDAEPHRYRKTISDIAGQDAAFHGNDPVQAIGCVRHFLARKSGMAPFVGADHIMERYARFTAGLPQAAHDARLTVGELSSLEYLPDLTALMTGWLTRNP
jgi:hypothetical protein